MTGPSGAEALAKEIRKKKPKGSPVFHICCEKAGNQTANDPKRMRIFPVGKKKTIGKKGIALPSEGAALLPHDKGPCSEKARKKKGLERHPCQLSGGKENNRPISFGQSPGVGTERVGFLPGKASRFGFTLNQNTEKGKRGDQSFSEEKRKPRGSTGHHAAEKKQREGGEGYEVRFLAGKRREYYCTLSWLRGGIQKGGESRSTT